MMATVLKRRAETNVSDVERWISIIGGTTLAGYGLTRRGKAGLGLAALGGGLLWRGVSGHCDVYQGLGVNTARRGHGKGTGMSTSVPYQLGVRVDADVQIARPAEELYRFWRDLENLPRFLDHIERIEVRDDRHSHWVVRGPAGLKVAWDAEIINEIENELIGWRSLPGSQVDNGGSVRFDGIAPNTTVVRVSLQYNPPAGALGAKISKLLGEDPERQIVEDLERFRELMQTGAVSSDKRGVAGRNERRRERERDTVQEASEESFPASDPPSWTPERV